MRNRLQSVATDVVGSRVRLLLLVGLLALGSVVSWSSASGAAAPAQAARDDVPAGKVICPDVTPGSYLSCLFVESPGASLRFYLYVPAGYDPAQRYPLVLLHGGGERAVAGNTAQQNRQVLIGEPYADVWGPGSGLPGDPAVQQRWPSFVVIPQVEAPDRYITVPASVGSSPLPAQPQPALRVAKEIVDTLQRQFAGIDPQRRYVTGVSMGGYAAWEMIERWPSYFPAAAPIAGAGDPARAAELANLPIWVFAGSDDPIVPVAGSRDMVAAIERAGGHPRYTEYSSSGHADWVYAYSIARTPAPWLDFYSWLFAQRNPSSVGLGAAGHGRP